MGKFVKENEVLTNLIKSQYFKNYYFVAMVMKKELPPVAELQEKLKKTPENKVLKEAVEILKDVTPEELKKINTKWGTYMAAVKKLGEEATALDDSLTKFAKDFKSDDADLTKANEWAVGPVNQRAALVKVYNSLNGFKASEKKANEENKQFDSDVKNNDSKVGVILLVLVLLAGCCSVGVCKW